jgi:hypothetical protein
MRSAEVDARQRSDAVGAGRLARDGGVALRTDVVRRLEVGVGVGDLADELVVALGREVLAVALAVRVDEAQQALVVLPRAVGRHQAEVEAGEHAERGDFQGVGGDELAVAVPGPADVVHDHGELGAELLAHLRVDAAAHAAGDGPGGVDLAAAEGRDHLLAEAAHADAAAGDLGLGLDQAEHVALGGVAVEAEQQVGGAEVEERQRVRLQDLAEVHHPAQAPGGGRRLDGQDRVAGLGAGQDVRDRADAAGAGGQGRHLEHGAAAAEGLEAAELGDVEAGVLDAAVVVQADGDLGVALDAGHGIDEDGLGHGPPPSQPKLRSGAQARVRVRRGGPRRPCGCARPTVGSPAGTRRCGRPRAPRARAARAQAPRRARGRADGRGAA